MIDVAVEAVDEVGNPTILATFAVIGAILPMAFVRGLMGPYMRPIPVGATAAMLFSLLVAFIVTPWAGVRLLRREEGGGHEHEEEGYTTRLYRKVMGNLLHRPAWRYGFLLLVVVLLLGSASLVAVGWVKVKMLPFDNKSEFQVMVDMPEGSTLEETAAAAREIGAVVARVPEVMDYQVYVGTASPYNFNGLVRHYFLRRGPHEADLQVNLVPKGDRKAQSHEIAKRVRPAIQAAAARHGANAKVAEVPPGPPVLQTLVAEVYGPDYPGQIEVARKVREIFEKTEGVVDMDWYVEDDQPRYRFEVDQAEGRAERRVHGTGGRNPSPGGFRHDRRPPAPAAGEGGRPDRSSASPGGAVEARRPQERPGGRASRKHRAPRRAGAGTEETAEKSIYHKNLMPVVYVTADVAGKVESPVYAILTMNKALDKLAIPAGYKLERHVAAQPDSDRKYSMKWDGEWHITYEVFRDLGLAFAAVLVLIYILVVGWFQSFRTPLTIMAAIPFSLVGILPAHGLMGAFFTATSMIGFIAGAGIVVRNSIILVDFVELRLSQGMPLDQAVIDAGAVRFRPMLLTAAAVIVGASVILFDPIFQGLAISLMAGEVASLLLSRMTVPILFFLSESRKR